jgi:hypothetical protein
MLRRRVSLALRIHGTIDPTLSADRVRTLHWNYGDKIDLVSRLGDFHRRRKACKPATDDRNFLDP